MALGALGRQLAVVNIFMTRTAACCQACEDERDFFALQHGPVRRVHVFTGVTLRAFQGRMLSFQSPPCLRVVKLLFRSGWPLHQDRLQAVVLRMATRAIIASAPRLHFFEVIAALLGDPARDFLVAIQALHFYLARSKRVALGAVQRTVQIGVSTTHRPR